MQEFKQKYNVSEDLINKIDWKQAEKDGLDLSTVKSIDLKILQHPWDLDNPTLFGDEKTWARQQCTGNWLIQLDADEIIQEPYCGAIRDVIKRNQSTELIDFPVINFYGDNEHTRIEDHCWKWRLSKNNPNIIHGVHAEARVFDAENMKITMNKSGQNASDGCEFIYADSLKIVPHKAAFPRSFAEVHYIIKQECNFEKYKEKYIEELLNLQKTSIVIYHYSWKDLNRKEKNGEFWDNTYHGKKSCTHNTSKDIKSRIEENNATFGVKEIIAHTPIKHPLSGDIE